MTHTSDFAGQWMNAWTKMSIITFVGRGNTIALYLRVLIHLIIYFFVKQIHCQWMQDAVVCILFCDCSWTDKPWTCLLMQFVGNNVVYAFYLWLWPQRKQNINKNCIFALYHHSLYKKRNKESKTLQKWNLLLNNCRRFICITHYSHELFL